MEAVVIGARTAQFIAGAILFGAPLFFLYGFRGGAAERLRWPRPVLAASAAALLVGAVVALGAQTAVMADNPSAAFDREMLTTVVAGTPFGLAMVARGILSAAAAAACIGLAARRPLWWLLSGLGAAALATFAWTGHGATEEGWAGALHAAADILHLWAGGAWLGALAALAILLRPRRRPAAPAELEALHAALAGFSGVGSIVVAVILLTGLVNSWFLVGPSRILDMPYSAYGVLLLIKLGVFVGMLGLAATNRFRLTPALARGLADGEPDAAVADLRQSVFVETGAGASILVLVGVLGTLAPVAAA